MCGEHPQRSPSSVKYSLSTASREISVKLQNLDTFSAIERRKWKLNTYKAEISLLRLLDVKRKHKAALHSWNVDLIHWPWFSFWKQEKRKPNINPWFGQAVTCAFFFVCHSCYFRWHVGEAYENIWNTKTDGGGTVHEKSFVATFCYSYVWSLNSKQLLWVVQRTASLMKPFVDVTVSDWNLGYYKLHTFAVNVTFVIFLNTE